MEEQRLMTNHDLWPVLKKLIPNLPEHVVEFSLMMSFGKCDIPIVRIQFIPLITEPDLIEEKVFCLHEISEEELKRLNSSKVPFDPEG
jgi:hypothetical protein